jgi:hypothetical protein
LISGAADYPEPAPGVDAKDPGVLAVDAVEIARPIERERFRAALREGRTRLDVTDRSRLPRSSAAPG